jgi:hypothetical protein
MSFVVVHYGSLSHVEKGCFYDYMAYMDILFICKQVFNVDIYGFKIRDDKWNQIFDDASTLKLMNMYQREERICIYVDFVASITMRMLRCFTGKIESGRRIGVKYFNGGCCEQ